MPQFNFFADAYLAKSGNKKEPYKVGGILTTEDRDTDGEIVKSIDWNYFTGGFGKIKYEHHDVKEPDCFVGFPTKLFKSGKAWHFEGELIPFDPEIPDDKLTAQQKLAKSMVSLLQHIEDFNSRHKGTPQKAGWSIEGEYLSKDPSGFVKARAVNVVFTTKPRNTNTFATLVKSLDMGYGMTPETQTGFAAFRKESIEQKTKINDGNSSNKSQNNKEGESKMFKTFEEIYKSCRTQGMKHEEALAEAKKQVAEKNKAVDDDFGKAEKSIGSSKEKLEKSLATLSDLSKIELDVDVEQHRVKMEKSIKTLQNAEEGEVDLGAFFKSQNEVLMNVLKSQSVINQKVDLLAKSISLTNEATKETLENDGFVRNATADLRGEFQQLEKSIGLLVKSIRGVATTTNLEEIQVAEDGKKPLPKISKSVMSNALLDLSKSGDIDVNTVIKFETTNQISDETMTLLKSKKPDLFK